ncbi:MAG: hypothetical protein K9N62_14710 [Verrucomicrobia bacterium]|nr:hypothetical protein [Verrucomicrobiota bacterium]
MMTVFWMLRKNLGAKLFFLPALAFWLVALDVTAAEARFIQDRFAIGYWVGPQTSENLETRYREIADANFTLVLGTPGMTPAAQLELCDKLGLRAIVDARSGGELADGPACWGYALRDEPNAADFPVLANQVGEIRRERPGRFGYINLFPNYASAAQLGTATYEEHVARFIDEVKPDVLSMDHYPLMRPDGDTRDLYCENLDTMRRLSLKAAIPFWNFFYSMPFNDRLDPTEAQIRWQIFTSVAYGAKGVLYFCYWTPGKGNGGTGEFPKGGAIITAEGLKTRHYDEARRINAELKNLGTTLMQLTSTGVYRVNTGAEPVAALKGSPVRTISRVRSDPHSEFIIGTFHHADGGKAVAFVNHSYSHTAWPTVEFTAPVNEVWEVNKTTGETRPVVDDSPELPGLQLSFGAGDARLFLLRENL